MVNKGIVDLHTHSTFSDGLLSPTELFERARLHGVEVMSITDHDSVAAYMHSETLPAAIRNGIELVPGVELSTFDPNVGKVHVLGLFIDPRSPQISVATEFQQKARDNYTADVTACLMRDGWELSEAQPIKGKSITKAFIADRVISHSQNANRLREVFGSMPTRGQFIESFMNPGGSCYVERKSLLSASAIEIIHAAGGLAVLAHPVANVHEGMAMDDLENHLRTHDYDALESMYYYFDKSHGDRKIDEIFKYTQLANKLGLLTTGGSDFHGIAPNIGNFTDIGFKDESQKFGLAEYNAVKAKVLSRP